MPQSWERYIAEQEDIENHKALIQSAVYSIRCYNGQHKQCPGERNIDGLLGEFAFCIVCQCFCHGRDEPPAVKPASDFGGA